jgi:two-component system LytT family response regulator
MNKLKTIIIDDEQDAVTSIKLIIEEFCPNLIVSGTANLIDDAWELIKNTNPDLIFLDVSIPRGTGFDLLERFPIRKFDVIFITAHTKYEDKSAVYGAFAYLQKPIDIDEFTSAVNKLTEFRKLNRGVPFKLGI